MRYGLGSDVAVVGPGGQHGMISPILVEVVKNELAASTEEMAIAVFR